MTGDQHWRTAAPEGVVVYDDTHAFLAATPERTATGWGPAGDLSGWDVADGFRLTDPSTQQASEWRISVMEETREVYAVLRREPLAELYTFDGPVWVIATVPDLISPSVYDRPIRHITDYAERLRPAHPDDSLLQATRHIQMAFGLLLLLQDDLFTLRDRATELLARDLGTPPHDAPPAPLN